MILKQSSYTLFTCGFKPELTAFNIRDEKRTCDEEKVLILDC